MKEATESSGLPPFFRISLKRVTFFSVARFAANWIAPISNIWRYSGDVFHIGLLSDCLKVHRILVNIQVIYICPSFAAGDQLQGLGQIGFPEAAAADIQLLAKLIFIGNT